MHDSCGALEGLRLAKMRQLVALTVEIWSNIFCHDFRQENKSAYLLIRVLSMSLS